MAEAAIPGAPKRGIVITGASSGLGEGLALCYAAPGAMLFLSGRDPARLERVAAACREKGAEAEGMLVDVANQPKMSAWMAHAESKAPLELVIANAGIAAEKAEGNDFESKTRAVFSTNLDGVLNTVLPVLPAMKARGRGQIVLMSSLAGFRGLPMQPAYCASKAAVRVWGEGLRLALAKQGIGVSVICPGFVKSRMTEGNSFPMPFLMETDRAIALIKKGIDANRARITFPWPMSASVWLLSALPPIVTDAALAHAPGG
jgi:short-subunit dehydrogenase